MIVASTSSKRGGLLDCGHQAQRGEVIYKLDTGDRGGTTAAGNGLGGWVCASCATTSDDQPG